MNDVKHVHPEFIWLQPWCTDCENSDVQADTGRCWSPDDPWGKCDECGRPAIKYKREISESVGETDASV